MIINTSQILFLLANQEIAKSFQIVSGLIFFNTFQFITLTRLHTLIGSA